MHITLIGHMTIRIEMDGIALLTDPWFGPYNWLERLLAPRTLPPSLTPDRVGHLDGILVSHSHIDHLDRAAFSLARREKCVFIGSEKASRKARSAGVSEVLTLHRGDEITLDGLHIRAVAADHPFAPDAIGFLLIGSKVIYFSGDTRLTPEVISDLSSLHIDVALVQAACARYPLLGDDGLSLPTVRKLVQTIRPDWTIPVHLHCAGKWLDRAEGLRISKKNHPRIEAALRRWREALEKEGSRVQLLTPGEEWSI